MRREFLEASITKKLFVVLILLESIALVALTVERLVRQVSEDSEKYGI